MGVGERWETAVEPQCQGDRYAEWERQRFKRGGGGGG